MMKTLLMITAVTLMMGPAFVYAQTLPTAGAARGDLDDDTTYEEVTTHTFEGDDVEGSLHRPGDENIMLAPRTGMINLIEVRSSFVPELLKSVEAL